MHALKFEKGTFDLGTQAAILGLTGFLDDLHEFNADTVTWTDLSSLTRGSLPFPRGGHGFASVGGRLYLQGGQGENGMHCYALVGFSEF